MMAEEIYKEMGRERKTGRQTSGDAMGRASYEDGEATEMSE